MAHITKREFFELAKIDHFLYTSKTNARVPLKVTSVKTEQNLGKPNDKMNVDYLLTVKT